MAMNLNSLELITQGRISDVFKRFMAFRFIFIGLLLLSGVPCIMMEENDKKQTPENETSLRDMMETWRLSDMSQQHFKLFQEVLQIMEKLNMFQINENRSGCFYLEKVMKEITLSERFPRKIGIHFYFQEPDINSDNKLTITQDGNIKSDQFVYANTNLKTENCNVSPSPPVIHGLDRLSRKQGDKNQKSTNDSTSNNNMTDASGAQQMGDGSGNQDDRRRGLSRTQVVVIATCSAVIGTFFIIAGAMRIHNCMKRYRANREAVIANARQTSAFGFGGSGIIRRDSASSKASRQPSHPASKAGSDTQVDRNGRSQHPNSHNSPQHCSDHNPLLPVHIVSQFSDGSSSHGSLAFIDEESHSRSKQNDHNSGSDLGSEDDPLLRKSPDSGSSIDIIMEVDDKVNVKDGDEYMKSSISSDTLKGRNSKSPKRILTSPEREVVFEPGGDTGSESNQIKHLNEKDTEMSTENTDDNENLDNKIDEDNIPITAMMTSQGESTNNSYNNDRDKDIPVEQLNSDKSKFDESVESKREVTFVITQSNENKPPRKQFSVDYFDVDDNGVEIQNPIFEESNEPEPEGQLSENQAITSGLTQSDSSISNNPSYCYGNQTEYDNSGGYGQMGYCCPYISKTDNDIKWLDNNLIQNSLRNSVLLSAETLRRENDDLLSESFDETGLGENNRKSSLVDESNKAKCTRMYSTDSYFANPVTQLSPFERTHSASPDNINEPSTASTDSTLSTKNLRIVPLAVYHRNSLKGTIDEDDAV